MKAILERIDAEFTEGRAKGFALIGAVLFLIIMGYVSYQMIFIDWNVTYRFGYDFSSFWAAAKLAVVGNAEWAFEIDRFDPLQDLAAKADGKLLWHYPPMWVAMLYPFGYVDPPVALFIFTGLTIAIWAFTVRQMIPATSWVQRIAIFWCPAFYLCIIGGQNGIIVTGLLCLFISGITARQEWMVVAACTLLLFKPHFGVLMPVVLLAIGWYRPIALTVLTGSLFVAWSVWMTGWPYLEAFLDNGDTLQSIIARTTLIDKQHSLFAFLVSINVPQPVALIAQLGVAASVIGLTWTAFRTSTVSQDLKIACFLFGSVMISPYAFIYDGAAAVIAMWYLHRATRADPWPGQNMIIAAAWLMPYVNRKFHEWTDVSWAGLAMILLLAVLIHHVRREMVAKPA